MEAQATPAEKATDGPITKEDLRECPPPTRKEMRLVEEGCRFLEAVQRTALELRAQAHALRCRLKRTRTFRLVDGYDNAHEHAAWELSATLEQNVEGELQGVVETLTDILAALEPARQWMASQQRAATGHGARRKVGRPRGTGRGVARNKDAAARRDQGTAARPAVPAMGHRGTRAVARGRQ